MQWVAANIRILFELVREGKLQSANIWDYLAYTVKIAEMAAVYKWDSVLSYDHAFRKAQAAAGFRWTMDSPYVDKMHLRFREEKAKPKAKGREQEKRAPKKICQLYQTNECNFGPRCWHKHICDVPGCGQNHPKSQHVSGNKAGNPFH